MNRREKFKKVVRDNAPTIIMLAVYDLAIVGVYTVLCANQGYYMNKPHHYDENAFFVKTIGGKILRSERLDVK